MQFKIIAGLSILAVIAGGVAFGPTLRDKAQERMQAYLNQQAETEAIVLKTTRPIPDDADLGAFLAGNMAFAQNNYQSAVHYYEKVLEKDSQNTDLKARLFLLYGIQGKMAPLFQTARDLEQADYELNFQNYIILSDLIQQQKYEEALTYIQTHFSESSQFVKSLLSAWVS